MQLDEATSGFTIERLRTFCRIAAAGSIAQAAKGDSTRQSQFSRQLKELEEFFGTELARRGRGRRAQGRQQGDRRQGRRRRPVACGQEGRLAHRGPRGLARAGHRLRQLLLPEHHVGGGRSLDHLTVQPGLDRDVGRIDASADRRRARDVSRFGRRAVGGRLEALLTRLKEPFDCVVLHGHALLTTAEYSPA